MQLSSLAVLSLLSSIASAAPVVETVTAVVTTTVIVGGQTSAINQAPVFTASASPVEYAAVADDATSSTAAAAAAVTPSPTTFETSYVAAATTDASETSSTSSADEQATNSSTSTTSAAAATTSASSDFASQILAEHNAKRALHGVSNLSWDDTLATYAQNYADKYDCSGSLTHSGGQYGENLALGYTVTGSVDAWYSEGDSYTYGSGCSVYDHFTQVIWKDTTKVGCGYKQCDSYWGTYIICSYDPAGNYVGECDSEVLPLA